MHLHTIRCFLTVAALISFTSTAFAQNIMFLRDSPYGWLDEADRKILRTTMAAALASPDGTLTEWFNPDSGSHGRIQVLDTQADLGTVCRSIKMRNAAQGRVNGGTYRLCKTSEGEWRFAPTSDTPADAPAATP